MRTRTLLTGALFCLATGCLAQTTDNHPERTKVEAHGDSIIIVKGKNNVRIKLYEQTGNGNEPYETEIYDGVYLEQTDEKQRSFLDALPFIPNKKNNNRYEPHIASIYIGFARLPEQIPEFSAGKAIPLNLGLSWEFGFNLIGSGFPFKNPHWGLNYGLGWGYRSFSIDGNRALVKYDGFSALENGGIRPGATPGTEEEISYSSSRLRHFFFRIPIQIEVQKRFHRHPLFFSFGPEVEIRHGIKSFTHINGGKKQRIGRDMYVNPVGVNLLVQAGYGDIGFYLRYSAIPLFQTDKGPDAVPYSFGLCWYW